MLAYSYPLLGAFLDTVVAVPLGYLDFLLFKVIIDIFRSHDLRRVGKGRLAYFCHRCHS